MSRSTDPGHFFQSASALADGERKAAKSANKSGDPIVLPSKILAVIADPRDGEEVAVFVAEAAGTVRRVLLETHETTHLYRGPTAPLTSIAISLSTNTLFAGCWDKSIWSWDLTTRAQRRKYIGHTDFVKAILHLPLPLPQPTHNGERRKLLLLSGGSDGSICIWDISSGARLHTLKGHARGILDLAIDPLAGDEPGDGTPTDDGAVTIFSAGSEREIRRWVLRGSLAAEVTAQEAESPPIVAHETSVNKLFFSPEGDLWTASSDKTARHLVRRSQPASSSSKSTATGWDVDDTLTHPDFVRAVVVDEAGGWVVTACRDEEVRVWSAATGALHHTFSGHFEEVTGLVLLGGRTVISVSIDATIRRWSLKAEDLKAAKEAAEAEKAGLGKVNGEQATAESLLTEDEERELAELMDDDED